MRTRNFSLMHCYFGSGWSSQKDVFDENTGFEGRLSPKICNSLPAEFVQLEGPSVVYNFMQESAWAVWKRLAAGVVFESPYGIHMPSSRPNRLLSELVSTIRSRLFRTENTMVICSYSYLPVQMSKQESNPCIGAESQAVGCLIHIF